MSAPRKQGNRSRPRTQKERDAARVLSWRRRLRVVHRLAQDLAMQSHYFREFRELIRASPKLNDLDGGGFFSSLQRAYSDSLSIAVRRIVDGDTRSTSLVVVLREMRDRPDLLSRSRYVRVIRPEWRRMKHGADAREDMRRILNKHFDELAGAGAPHPRASDIKRDLDALIRATKKIRHHVNRRVAHHDHRRFRTRVTFEELLSVADLVERILAKYGKLSGAGYSSRLLPKLPDGWKRFFGVGSSPTAAAGSP